MSTTALRVLSAVAVLLATASATFTSPVKNTSWDVNSEHQISWDTAGLKEPLTMHLAPAGSTDASSYIATLAPSIPNTGSWTWYPTTSIPSKHKSITIIIIDSGGHHQMSPPVQLVGWPQLIHTSMAAPVHTTSLYVAPIVHTSMIASVHSMPPPMVHTSVVVSVHTTTTPPPMVHTTIVEAIAPVHTMVSSIEIIAPVHTMVSSIEAIAPVHTIIQAVESAIVVTSLWVSPIVHTSQPAPIVKTVELAPIIQTELIAPIVMTQTQEPVTKIVTQPAVFSTEYPAAIIKTILVTETQEPIVHEMSQPALTVVETLAPVLVTEIQAPIVKTLTQAPHIVTENIAPILVTSELTQTHLLTSHVIVTPAHTMIVAPLETTTSELVVHTPVVVVVHTPAPILPVHSTLIIVHTSAAPIFPNTTASAFTFTTPLALMATASGVGSLQPIFVPNAASRSGSGSGVSCFLGFVVASCLLLI